MIFLRATETVDESQVRRLNVAAMAAQRRQTFKSVTWCVFENAAIEYDATLDNKKHSLLKIDRLERKCIHCRSLKWKEESSGMCCSGGKVSLFVSKDPVFPIFPIKDLYIAETEESRKSFVNININS